MKNNKTYDTHYFCRKCYNENTGKPTGNWVEKSKAVDDTFCPICGHILRKKPKDTNWAEKYYKYKEERLANEQKWRGLQIATASR